MTDKQYLITEAQIEELNKVFPDNDWGQTLEDMLQSLPMVRDGPVAYLAHYYIEPTMHTPADDGFDVVEPMTEGTFPVFASPQALTPITADDVSDKTVIDLWRIGVLTSTGTQGKEIAAKVYNAVIKHRSEAR